MALAPPFLRRLVATLGETAHLSVLEGDQVLTLLSERSPRQVQASDWTGRRVPAHCTSSGRALLMDENRSSLAALLDVRGAELGQLERRMARVRELGYAAVEGEFEPGLVGVAAPVRDFRGRITAAVNVSGPEFRFGDCLEPAGEEVGRAARELSRRLGQSSEGGRHG